MFENRVSLFELTNRRRWFCGARFPFFTSSWCKLRAIDVDRRDENGVKLLHLRYFLVDIKHSFLAEKMWIFPESLENRLRFFSCLLYEHMFNMQMRSLRANNWRNTFCAIYACFVVCFWNGFAFPTDWTLRERDHETSIFTHCLWLNIPFVLLHSKR